MKIANLLLVKVVFFTLPLLQKYTFITDEYRAIKENLHVQMTCKIKINKVKVYKIKVIMILSSNELFPVPDNPIRLLELPNIFSSVI